VTSAHAARAMKEKYRGGLRGGLRIAIQLIIERARQSDPQENTLAGGRVARNSERGSQSGRTDARPSLNWKTEKDLGIAGLRYREKG